VYIEEWHFGDEGWVFDVGSSVRIHCDLLRQDELTALHDLWDEQSLRDLSYSVGDVGGGKQVLAGVITSIAAFECRFPSPDGGRAIPGSGIARQVRQARGWTGDVDASKGLVLAFVIDLEVAP
jgi:hypothetical protein